MSHEMEALTGLVRGTMAGILLLMFIGLWFWVYSKSRRATFESAARLPLEEDRIGADKS
jgi:cytochrome c oxidase cbb3-type subunit 4